MANLTIEYTNSMEDLLQFTVFHTKSSRAGRRLLRMNAAAGAALGFAIVNAFAAGAGAWTPVVILPGLVLGALTGALAWRIGVLSVKRHASNQYGEGNSMGIFGWHELTLTDDTLEERSEGGSMVSNLSGIDRIDETDDYVYVYVSSVQAHVVPRDKVLSGDLQKCVAALRARTAGSR